MSRSKARAPRIIAGRHRGRVVEVPEGTEVRPTASRTREALFNILAHGQPPLEGCRFLDLFCGSGAVGLEARSRGAAEVLLVEQDTRFAEIARRNIRTFDETDHVSLMITDATRLAACPLPFDIVFLDPPYRRDLIDKTLQALIFGEWLKEDGLVVCETAAKESLVPPCPLVTTSDRQYGAGRLVILRQVNDK